MQKFVKAKFCETHAKVLRYRNGEMVSDALVFMGKLSPDRAQSRLRRIYNDNTIIVVSVEYVTKTYACDVDAFLNMAEVVE